MKVQLNSISKMNQKFQFSKHIRFIGRDMEHFPGLLLYIIKGTKLIPVNLKNMYPNRIIDFEESLLYIEKRPRYFTNMEWCYL